MPGRGFLAGRGAGDQEGSGRARSLARAPLNRFCQGRSWERCGVRRRALRVRCPAGEKQRGRRVLVAATGPPRPMRTVRRPGCRPSSGRPAGRRWRASVHDALLTLAVSSGDNFESRPNRSLRSNTCVMFRPVQSGAKSRNLSSRRPRPAQRQTQ